MHGGSPVLPPVARARPSRDEDFDGSYTPALSATAARDRRPCPALGGPMADPAEQFEEHLPWWAEPQAEEARVLDSLNGEGVLSDESVRVSN